jgi:hypothetical protein
MHVAQVSVTAWRWLRCHGWLVMAAACGLVIFEAMDFSPPERVRVDEHARSAFVGDAPRQEFNESLGNPQAVQIRTTMREYAESDLDATSPDPEVDAHARVLSQPVVTTIFGLTANVDQTVHLEGGDVRVDVAFEATPRLVRRAKKSSPPRLSLEHSVYVRATRERAFGSPDVWTVVSGRGVLMDLDDEPYRLTFTVDGHLFALDVELNHGT